MGKVETARFSVGHNSVDVRREDGVGVIVDGNRRVCPPEEGLGKVGIIIEAAFDLDIGFAGIESEEAIPLVPYILSSRSNERCRSRRDSLSGDNPPARRWRDDGAGAS